MNWIFFSLHQLILILGNNGIAFAWFNTPSFTSDWVYFESQNTVHTSNPIIIYHNFGEYPAKVDVQIKVNRSGSEVIFSGFGSAHRDDDDYNNNALYGGVVYIYNQNNVRLHYPISSNTGSYTSTGGIAYTGGSEYDGPFYEHFTKGLIRVRAWKMCDLPLPAFSDFTLTIGRYSPDYLEIPHHLGVYPDFVVVQIKMDNHYMSEAQGAVFQDRAPTLYSYGTAMGGVLYGYNEQFIRIWGHQSYVFYNDDGWGSYSILSRSGHVRVLAWTLEDDDIVFQQTFENSKLVASTLSTNTIHLNQSFSFDNYLVIVQAKAMDGANTGFLFNAAGSAIVDGSYTYFGATVYAYTNDTVYIWKPSRFSSYGHMIYIDYKWGDGYSNEQISDNATMVIKIIKTNSSETVCGLGSCVTQFDTSYTCNCTGSNASGQFCQYPLCATPSSVDNADMLYTGIEQGHEVLYSCLPGYGHSSGDLRHSCQTGSWIGSPLNCTLMPTGSPSLATCTPPSPKPYTTVLYNDTVVGSVALYACVQGYYPTSGDGIYTCDSTGLWNGNSSFQCSVVPTTAPSGVSICTPPSPKPFTRLLYNDTVVGSVALYACVQGYYPTSGDGIYICDSTGLWNGNSSFQCSEYNPVTCSSAQTGVYGNLSLEERIAQITNELKVNPNTTSAYRRSLTCAPDPRPSAAFIGYTGVILLVCILGILLCADVTLLCKSSRDTIY